MTGRPDRIMPRVVFATVIVVLAVGSDLRANEGESDKLDSFITQGMRDWSLTGLAVAVVKEDKVVFIRGYGVSDIRTKTATDEHTVFQIGSASKPLTASGIALLVQDGKIKWDTPIVDKWASFGVADPAATQRATLRDILCHRTGVGKDESVLYYGMPITRTELLRRLPEVQQAAPFRTEWRYSNLMYSAAGQVVEEITGESWDEYLSQRVFQPLGMTRTYTSMKSLAQVKNVAVPHVRVKDETFPTAFADQDNIGPAASISSSAKDLSQWLLMMVNEGRYEGRQILNREVVSEMQRPQILMPFSDPAHGQHNFNAYGLGLMLCDDQGRRLAKHPGMSGHSLAMLGFVPEERVGVVVLTNHRPCLFHYAVFRRAIDLYCGMPPVDLDSANKTLLAEHLGRQEQSLKRQAETRDASKKPTLPLEGYAGLYEREFGLRAQLEMDSDHLILRYGHFVADVEHWHDDTFRARLRERRLAAEQDWHLTFTVAQGVITKLHIDSEHDVHADFVSVAESGHQAKREADKPSSTQPTKAKTADSELHRRAMFGAQLAPVTKEVQERQKLVGDGGVVIEKIFPGTSAADAEFQAGDVILDIGGIKVAGVPMFLEKIEEARAGEVITVDVVRDGVKMVKQVTLQEMPRETGEGYEVIYGSVTSHGARLRTIVTRPNGVGPHPAVLLLQGGHGCFSVDQPAGPLYGFTWVARNLAGHGYVTMRIDRPGCGDSEGGPLRDVDFNTELDGNKQALKALKRFDFVDRDNVFLFGHSMGGIMAPLIAVEEPVRGIAVYGTLSATWFEGVVGQRRRLASLDGTNPAEVDGEVLAQARFWYPLMVERKTPREIREQDPDLPKRVYDQWVTDDKYVGERSYTYHHQIADRNLAEAWTKVAATRLPATQHVPPPEAPAEMVHPRVLAIWGTTDWASTKSQSTWIAEIVNRVQPGNGTFVALDSTDHFFFHVTTPEESYRYFKPVKAMPPTKYNPAIIETLCAWLDESSEKGKKEPKTPPTAPDRDGSTRIP